VKVARLHGAHDVRIHDEARPAPAAGEVLVKVEAVGICGSDLHWYEDGGIGGTTISRPLVPGHEFAGRTEDGTLVAVDPAVSCGHCLLCHEGHPNLCPSVRFAGYGADDGALREWMSWPPVALVPLPKGLSATDGAMLEPLGVALHAVDLAHVQTGSTVGVLGCGPIGLFVLQVAKLAGAARLVATDLASRPHRLEAARALGAEVFAADEGREARAIVSAVGGLGVDTAIEAAGTAAAVDAAIDAARPGARVVLVGISSAERTSFRASPARRKGLTIALARRMKHVYPRAIALTLAGRVDLRSMVTHRFPLAEAGGAFALAARREGLKVVVEP
jgi:L-iditol 2-dehydrogenase